MGQGSSTPFQFTLMDTSKRKTRAKKRQPVNVQMKYEKTRGSINQKKTIKSYTVQKNTKAKKKSTNKWTSSLHLNRGTLSKFGYSVKLGAKVRRDALTRAIGSLPGGQTTVLRKLIVVATLQRNSNPKNAQKLRADAKWVKKRFGTTANPTI